MRRLFAVVAGIIVTLLVSTTLWAKTVYFKNGDEIDCQSYRQQGDKIVVTINSETEIDFALEEVDFGRTPGIKSEAANKNRKVTSPVAAIEPEALHVSETTEPPPEDTTWWRAGNTPENYQEGTPQLRKELAAVFVKYNRAAESGAFNEVAKYMPRDQAQQSLEALSKVTDKKERLQRKKNLQGMAVKNMTPQKCALSPDGRIAALTVKGKKMKEGKYQEAHGTVKFLNEEGEWKVSFQIW